MRSRLRRFALVGSVATALDFGLVVLLAGNAALWAVDVVALVASSLFAYLANRFYTFRADPTARWVRQPALFFSTATIAGALDVSVLLVAVSLSVPLGPAKVIAVLSAAILRWAVYRWILFGVVRREMGLRIDRPDPPGIHRLTVVVPAYNEGERIAQTVAALSATLQPTMGDDVQILVVDDGSSDATSEIALRAGADVLTMPENRGKGAAVRAGMIEADGRTVVFTDADLAYPPELVAEIALQVEQGWDIVVGSRRHEDTTTLVRARWFRELGGRFVNWLTHLVLLGHFRDTQCGIKGFRGDVGRVVFQRCRVDGFAFDVEVFLIAEQDRLSVKEVPVSVENRQGSTVRLAADTARLFLDLIRIRRAAGWGWYDPSPAQAAVLNHRGDAEWESSPAQPTA